MMRSYALMPSTAYCESDVPKNSSLTLIVGEPPHAATPIANAHNSATTIANEKIFLIFIFPPYSNFAIPATALSNAIAQKAETYQKFNKFTFAICNRAPPQRRAIADKSCQEFERIFLIFHRPTRTGQDTATRARLIFTSRRRLSFARFVQGYYQSKYAFNFFTISFALSNPCSAALVYHSIAFCKFRSTPMPFT